MPDLGKIIFGACVSLCSRWSDARTEEHRGGDDVHDVNHSDVLAGLLVVYGGGEDVVLHEEREDLTELVGGGHGNGHHYGPERESWARLVV